MGHRGRERIGAEAQSSRGYGVHAHNPESDRTARAAQCCEVERQFLDTLQLFDMGDYEGAFGNVADPARRWAEGIGGVPDETPPLVPSLLWSRLLRGIEQAWERGWQPADVPRVASRHLGANHARLAVDVIADQAKSYRRRQRTLPSWMDQLDEIGAAVR